MPEGIDPFAIPIQLNGASLLAEASGALWWPDEGTLIVADLHFEKGSSFAASGQFLPPYDTVETLSRLDDAARRHGLKRVICVGDSFHDGDGPARLAAEDKARLRRLTDACDWVWIAGNHDPHPPNHLGGRMVAGELAIGPLVLRHIARADAAPGEISGHYHPQSSVRVRGRRLAGPCFIHDRRRLVMPAFGAYTGGLDIEDDALQALFADEPSVHLLVRRRIVTLSRVASL
jgi:DNA ligase-associated metallophosphoesterase